MDITGYLDLIPSENSREINGSPNKFMRFLEGLLEPIMDLKSCVQGDNAFDVNSAAGDQLDMIGELVGISRELPFVPSSGWPFMADTEYAVAIKLRIAQEAWDGTNKTAADIYQSVVGEILNVSFADNLDGSIDINTDAAGKYLSQIFSTTGIFLVPAGVGVTIVENAEPASERTYYGIALTGMSYEVSFGFKPIWEDGQIIGTETEEY